VPVAPALVKLPACHLDRAGRGGPLPRCLWNCPPAALTGLSDPAAEPAPGQDPLALGEPPSRYAGSALAGANDPDGGH